MGDSSSGSDSHQIGQYSTPQGIVSGPLSCSISSVSGGNSSVVKKVLSHPRYNKDNQDEDTDGIFGDAVREHAIIPKDIQSVGMEQLFHRAEDVALHKIAYEPCLVLKAPAPSEILPQQSSLDDDAFDGMVGEHHRTYTRVHSFEKRISPEKEEVSIYFKADLLWKNFMEGNVAFHSRKNKKYIRRVPIKSAPKFFKTRGQEFKQRQKVDRASPEGDGANNLGLFMPSLKRPLGWMAIRGIGYAERREVCDKLVYSPEDASTLKSYEPVLKKRRDYRSTEYPSPPM